MRHKLVRLFRSCVEAHGAVYVVIRGIRDLLVRAVNAGAGGINKMLDGVVSASLKNVIETDYVRFYVYVGVVNGISDTRLSGEVNDNAEAVFLEKRIYEGFIGDTAAYKVPVNAGVLRRFILDLAEAVLLQRHVVVIVHVIESDYRHGLSRAHQ